MRALKRNLYIFGRLIVQQLKAILEYQSDFWITLAAAALTQALGFIFLWVIYQNIPEINGWQFWEIVFLYAMIFFTEGVGSAFFDGIWRIGQYVNQGDFDRMLVRPVPALTQVLGSAVGMNGYGNLILGAVLIARSFAGMNLTWTLTKALFALLLLVSATVIRMSINIVANAASFWLHSNHNALAYMVHTAGDFGKYPIGLFPSAVKVVICVAVPYAFISYFPAAYIFGREGRELGMMTPLVAVACAAVACVVFYAGLQRYDSTGN